MKLRKIIFLGVATILLLQTKSFSQSNQPTAPIDTNVIIKMVEAYAADLAANPPLSRADCSNKMAALYTAYRNEKIDKGVAMVETFLLDDNMSQDFYGTVIDQHGQPVVGADVTGQIILEGEYVGEERIKFHAPTNNIYKAKTDAEGLFQVTGLRGALISISIEKQGCEPTGYHPGWQSPRGAMTSVDNRMTLKMWKLKGPEPLIHNEISSRKMQPDGRIYKIDFVKNEISEGTNAAGDMLVQIQRPPQVKHREQFDWSFVMTAIGGGFIEVTNDFYLNEAPENGYQQEYRMDRYATNVYNFSTYPLYRTDRTFFLKSRGGQVYGHFHIKELDPAFRDGMPYLQIEFFVNPAGSRNLEFDPTKQIH